MIENFRHLLVVNEQGIPVSSETDKTVWLQYRNKGVTATDINKIISPTLKLSSQRKKLLENKRQAITHIDSENTINSYMAHGNTREPIIVDWASDKFGITGNGFLFHNQNNLQHLATPDGLGDDFVVEIKTSIKTLSEVKQGYMNQIQWQLHVMNVPKCLFLVEQHENFSPLEVQHEWIYRDEERIKLMEKHVNLFIHELNGELPF